MLETLLNQTHSNWREEHKRTLQKLDIVRVLKCWNDNQGLLQLRKLTSELWTEDSLPNPNWNTQLQIIKKTGK